MVKFKFFISDQKYTFWANLVQKIKIVSLRWNLVPRIIQIWRIQWQCSLFFFRLKVTFLGKFGLKNQNSQFKLKFGALTNSYMQISVVEFTFSILEWKYPFWANMIQKIKVVSSGWNLMHRLIGVCRIQWSCSHFGHADFFGFDGQ